MATAALSPTRALRKPRHLDLRAVVGLFLLLVAVAGSVAFWSASAGTRAVLIVTRDLSAGSTLSAGDLAVARVRLDPSMDQATIPANALSTVIGKHVAEPLHPEEMLSLAQLTTGPALGPQQMALTIPVSPDTAAGGQVHAGDAVEVLVTTGKDTPVVRTSVALPRVTVYAVGFDQQSTVISTTSSGTLASGRGPINWLTVIVTPTQAMRLARARWSGQLDVALLPR